MTNPPRIRPFSLWHLLALNRPVLWRLAIGATLLMLALSLALTGAPLGGFGMGCFAAAMLLWGGYDTRYLLQHELPVLRTGTLVAAKVTGTVKDAGDNLYRITYRLPGDEAERNGIFLAANQSSFGEGEPVAIMIDPRNPEQLVEISGRYEPLFDHKKKAAA